MSKRRSFVTANGLIAVDVTADTDLPMCPVCGCHGISQYRILSNRRVHIFIHEVLDRNLERIAQGRGSLRTDALRVCAVDAVELEQEARQMKLL